MKIGNREINKRPAPYLIAEIGANYYDIAEKYDLALLDAAKKMIHEASEHGADAVKFQSYKAEKLATQSSPAYWDTSKEETKSQYELFQKYDSFGEQEYKRLAETAEKEGVHFLSTPFDLEAVDYLDDLVPAFKIASGDITNFPLLKHTASKKKPILLSTGASTISEIESAVNTIQDVHSEVEIGILHCILDYPTKIEDANLAMIGHLKDVFPMFTPGYSDHVPPDDCMVALLSAVFQGAQIIEKHFTLDKTIPGNDHYHAMNPGDLTKFRNLHTHYKASLGSSYKQPVEAELSARKYARRSIVSRKDIQPGEEITREKVIMKRPGTGIPPNDLEKILNRKASTGIEKDQVLTWEMIE